MLPWGSQLHHGKGSSAVAAFPTVPGVSPVWTSESIGVKSTSLLGHTGRSLAGGVPGAAEKSSTGFQVGMSCLGISGSSLLQFAQSNSSA